MIAEEGLTLIGERKVPTDNSSLGWSVLPTEPNHLQVFIGRGSFKGDQDAFERQLYLVRKMVSNSVQAASKGGDIGHYSVSLSTRTLVYKGMFMSYQVQAYYKDLSDPRVASAVVQE